MEKYQNVESFDITLNDLMMNENEGLLVRKVLDKKTRLIKGQHEKKILD